MTEIKKRKFSQDNSDVNSSQGSIVKKSYPLFRHGNVDSAEKWFVIFNGRVHFLTRKQSADASLVKRCTIPQQRVIILADDDVTIDFDITEISVRWLQNFMQKKLSFFRESGTCFCLMHKEGCTCDKFEKTCLLAPECVRVEHCASCKIFMHNAPESNEPLWIFPRDRAEFKQKCFCSICRIGFARVRHLFFSFVAKPLSDSKLQNEIPVLDAAVCTATFYESIDPVWCELCEDFFFMQEKCKWCDGVHKHLCVNDFKFFFIYGDYDRHSLCLFGATPFFYYN